MKQQIVTDFAIVKSTIGWRQHILIGQAKNTILKADWQSVCDYHL